MFLGSSNGLSKMRERERVGEREENGTLEIFTRDDETENVGRKEGERIKVESGRKCVRLNGD